MIAYWILRSTVGPWNAHFPNSQRKTPANAGVSMGPKHSGYLFLFRGFLGGFLGGFGRNDGDLRSGFLGSRGFLLLSENFVVIFPEFRCRSRSYDRSAHFAVPLSKLKSG